MPSRDRILEHTRECVRKYGPSCALNTRPIAEDLFRGIAILQTIVHATSPQPKKEEDSFEEKLAIKMINIAWMAEDMQIDLAQAVFAKMKVNLD